MAERRRPRLSALLERWRPVAAGLAVVVAVNLALHVLVIRRLVRVSGDREAILATEPGKLNVLAAEVQQLERTASKVACTTSDVRHVMDDLLSSKEERMTSIVREVRRLAADNGMDPDRISYNWTPLGQSDLVQFRISFPLTGSYETLRTFIRQVEGSPNFLIIEDVSLTGDRVQSGLRLQVNVMTYFQAPDLERLRAVLGPGRS